MSDKRRIPWLDHARGLGIVLVVLAHALATAEDNGRLYSVIYSFHMPLFFVLSGLARGMKPDENLVSTARKLAQTLLVPFAFFGLVTLCYYILLQKAVAHEFLTLGQIALAAARIFYGVGEWMPINSPLWFFPCMFVTMLLSLALVRLIGSRPAFVTTAIAAVAIMVLPPPVRLFWSADTAVIAACFFQIGMFLRAGRLDQTLDRIGTRPATIALGMICLAATAYLSMMNISVDMAAIRFGNPILFAVAACSGVAGIFLISGILPAIPFKRLSDDARVIFPLHLIFFSVITAFVTIALHVDRYAFQNSSYAAVIYSTLSIAGSIVAASALRRTTPQAIGEARKRR